MSRQRSNRTNLSRRCTLESLENRELMAADLACGELYTPAPTHEPAEVSEMHGRRGCSELDYGDAPDSSVGSYDYPTRAIDDGARHVATGPMLGELRDTEKDGQPSVGATRDGVDEDGVTLLPGVAIVSVSAGEGEKPFLNGWIDFNRDGDWDDSGEQIFDDVAVSDGINTLEFDMPTGFSGETYARFRLSNQAGLETTGLARDGEVEDYVFACHGRHWPSETLTSSASAESTDKNSDGNQESREDSQRTDDGFTAVGNDSQQRERATTDQDDLYTSWGNDDDLFGLGSAIEDISRARS